MNQDELQGKIAIVTGASSGIGRATALSLARKGVTIVAASRNEVALSVVGREIEATGGKALVVPTDVGDRGRIQSLVRTTLDRFGKVDFLVCSAGIYLRCPVRDLSTGDIERVMSVNFYGVVNCILALLPPMLERKSGHIVVVSSVDGKKGLPPDGAYVASKFAVNGFLDVLRQELRGTGVCVSTVLPGRVDTPMIETLTVPRISRKIPSERVARAVLHAIRGRGGEYIVPYLGPKTLVLSNAVSPRFGDWLVRILGLEGTEETS